MNLANPPMSCLFAGMLTSLYVVWFLVVLFVRRRGVVVGGSVGLFTDSESSQKVYVLRSHVCGAMNETLNPTFILVILTNSFQLHKNFPVCLKIVKPFFSLIAGF